MVAKFDRRSALLVSEQTGFVAKKRWSEQILLNQVGCEARKRPAVGEVFFLDFYLYRTNQDLAATERSQNP